MNIVGHTVQNADTVVGFQYHERVAFVRFDTLIDAVVYTLPPQRSVGGLHHQCRRIVVHQHNGAAVGCRLAAYGGGQFDFRRATVVGEVSYQAVAGQTAFGQHEQLFVHLPQVGHLGFGRVVQRGLHRQRLILPHGVGLQTDRRQRIQHLKDVGYCAALVGVGHKLHGVCAGFGINVCGTLERGYVAVTELPHPTLACVALVDERHARAGFGVSGRVRKIVCVLVTPGQQSYRQHRPANKIC